MVMIISIFAAAPMEASAKTVVKPKGTTITKLTSGVTSISATWKKRTKLTSGYKLQYAANSKFSKSKTVTIKNKKTVKTTVKKLKSNKKYYVRIRTYRTVKGKNYYSAWSKAKSVTTKKAADAKDALLAKIKQKTNKKITHTFYADYDGDGKKELFATAGSKDLSVGEKQIWFASLKQVKRLYAKTALIYSSKQVKINSKQRMLIIELGAGGSGSDSYWYYVASEKVKEKPSSQVWCGLTQIKGAQFYAITQNFDNWTGNVAVGHTYKRYYYKWNGKAFKEYVGTKISKDKLKGYQNASSYIDQIRSLGYKVGTIYQRKNGIININISKSEGNGTTRNENINLKFSKKKVSLIVINKSGEDIVKKSSFGGIYRASSKDETY